MELRDRFVQVVDEKEFDALIASGKPLRVKAGFDPTAPDLHLGHAVLLKTLRTFQDHGHTVMMIVGTATAAIGDPTGRNSLRPALDEVIISRNALTYLDQVYKILDKDKTCVHENNKWFDKFSFADVIRLLSSFTLQQIMARDDFKKRFADQSPIHLHELVYPLLQAYDSHIESVDIELGGTDQLFNLMIGREYMRLRKAKPQVIATVPLLEGLDGVQKMSKSLGNHIALNEAPFEMFSKVMSISDALMFRWWGTLFPEVFINPASPDLDRRICKLELAWRIVEWLHDRQSADIAQEEWEKQFTRGEKPTDIEEVSVQEDRLDRVMVAAGMASSNTEAQRLIKAGAVEIDDCRISGVPKLVGKSTIRVGRKWKRVNVAH